MKRKTSLKSKYTCSHCTRILKEPILMPCSDNICAQHLNETNLTQIKCSKCIQSFDVKSIKIQSNKCLKKLLDEKLYLSSEEKQLKRQIEESIQNFHHLNATLNENKISLEMVCFDHFQELCRQIDLHREESIPLVYVITTLSNLNEKYLEMLKQIKTFEYFKFQSDFRQIELKTFEQDLNDLEETFRDPTLSVYSIKQILSIKEKNKADIKTQLNEMLIIKEHLQTNEFKPSFNSLEFGRLYLFKYPYDSFNSQILRGSNQAFELVKLCGFNFSDKWRLIYRGTRDGFEAHEFHTKCDDLKNTLCIFKSQKFGYIFGGYTEVTWSSLSQQAEWKSDPNAFIFSLTNKENKPVKMRTQNVARSIYCAPKCGPIFGCGDIAIANHANKTDDSHSNLGATYMHPQYLFKSREALWFLAGEQWFQLSEIEIYLKEE
jgi:hypothetical protein